MICELVVFTTGLFTGMCIQFNLMDYHVRERFTINLIHKPKSKLENKEIQVDLEPLIENEGDSSSNDFDVIHSEKPKFRFW